MADWQIAPPEYEIITFDAPKFRYRKYVEDLVHQIPVKSAKKKTFVTISTNVLCAEIDSKGSSLNPADRDIYKPLEIAITKWSVADYKCKSRQSRSLTSKTWILDPGPPANNTNNWANDHQKIHKIDFKSFSPKNPYIERDLQKVVKEINALLTVDRTVFSNTLKHCRQDLGCLKWLNRETGYKIKPINVYSVEDLYVVLLRRVCPEGYPKDFICQGVARFNYDSKTNAYESEDQCRYHRDRLQEDSNLECKWCAKSIADGWGHVILDGIQILLDDVDTVGDAFAGLNLGTGGDQD